MALFTYCSKSIRALVTYTSLGEKELEVQVDYQRFRYGDFSAYNFPNPGDGQPRSFTISAFLVSQSSAEEIVEVRKLCGTDNEALFGVFAPRLKENRDSLPDAYVLLIPY